MHYEVLVEDASGKLLLEPLMEKVLGPHGDPHTWRIIKYKGIGRLPADLRGHLDPQKRILLDRLPKILRGYGKSRPPETNAVIVVVDLDTRDCKEFKAELNKVLSGCNPAPQTLFRIAIEEMEAWILGDRAALLAAYPRAKADILDSYKQDSICNTWEKLADAIHPGGARQLLSEGWPRPGVEKCTWAENIAPQMDVENNRSRSFQVFVEGLRRFAQ